MDLGVSANKIDVAKTDKPTEVSIKTEKDINDDAEYTYKRNIVVKAIETLSAYRQQNISVMGRRVSNIGSSITSVNTLCANEKELAVLYPNIVGISANHPNFHNRVKEYLSNIQCTVSDKVAFNSTLIFNHYKDYVKFSNEENRINTTFDNTDKRSIKDLKAAIKRKIDSINKLESTFIADGLCKPENYSEYIMYRHCLLYNSITKDTNLIGGDKNIRFYLVDESREKIKQQKLLRERKNASTNFIAICGDDAKFEAVYIRYCTDNKFDLFEYMAKERTEKEILIEEFSRENPYKFNSICTDTNLVMSAFIEKLIARGELVRLENNQQISTPDGSFIGKNMIDAVAFFNNPENKAIRDSFEAKLKVLNY